MRVAFGGDPVMSAWQFKVKILPARALVAHHGGMPDHVEIVRFDKVAPLEELERQCDELPNDWDGSDNSEAVQREIAEVLPEKESWSSLARMFGENGKDEIELWYKADGQLSRITLSFSLSEPNPEFVQRVLELANRFDLRLLAIQSQEVFDPSITSFITQAEKCSAARFVPTGKGLSDLLG
jgi:hypothetical protein